MLETVEWFMNVQEDTTKGLLELHSSVIILTNLRSPTQGHIRVGNTESHAESSEAWHVVRSALQNRKAKSWTLSREEGLFAVQHAFARVVG
ncbi:hypothetical protein TNCV_1842741 [Trichonephila clavipes]|nr:hypothetical protein TNCV_1842741 [Trichonephila clavipes]